MREFLAAASEWSVETWLMTALSAVIVPSVAWLVGSVIRLQKEIAELQVQAGAWREHAALQFREIEKGCTGHREWLKELTATINKIDRNVVRLNEKLGTSDRQE